MGAKYTGVFMLSHLDGVLPTAADATAMTIVNSDKIHYAMKHRTAVRHRVRSKRDLFWLVDCLILLLTIS